MLARCETREEGERSPLVVSWVDRTWGHARRCVLWRGHTTAALVTMNGARFTKICSDLCGTFFPTTRVLRCCESWVARLQGRPSLFSFLLFDGSLSRRVAHAPLLFPQCSLLPRPWWGRL